MGMPFDFASGAPIFQQLQPAPKPRTWRVLMHRSIVSLALLLVMSSVASAQFGTLGQAPQRPRPTVSPYINQGVGGGLNAFNYYGIIKPQFETNRSINQLQTGVQLLNADGSLKGALSQSQPNALGGMQTGHPATYFNYSHYFPMSYGSTTATGAASSFGTGVGGMNSGVGSVNTGAGGVNSGVRGFYGSTLNNIVR
jgi:hypothetical protein